MNHLLVTGANGFVGGALCARLLQAGHRVTGIVRRAGTCPAGVEEWVHPEADFVGIDAAWRAGSGADALIHLAARVHVMHDDAQDPEAAFRASNVDATLRLARAAQANGVRRFVFVSSIKAVGEADHGTPLDETAPCAPEDAYGRSKLAAETGLRALHDAGGLDCVIVRPPLVYGPEVRANYLSMLRAVARGLPLPLKHARARRSMVYVDNLADALARCATDARAAGGTFHVADPDTPTIAGWLTQLGRHLGRPARLLPVPVALLRLAGALTGRAAQIERLTTDLRVDGSRLMRTLDWQPPVAADEGLARTAHWFRSHYKR
ncbi:MAG: SDR family oxidoreductase [Burkholderia gladioli]